MRVRGSERTSKSKIGVEEMKVKEMKEMKQWER